MEDVAIGILQSRNFGKYSLLFLVEHNSIFGAEYYTRKNNIFLFTDVLSLIHFQKNS